MAKINGPRVSKPDNRFDNSNPLPGGMGSAVSTPVQYLRRLVLSYLLWEDGFYVDGKTIVSEIQHYLPLCTPEEVRDVVLEARLEQHLRHIPLFLIVEMAKLSTHKKYIRNLIPKVCTRVDMLTDLLALYWKDGKKPISAQIKRGIQDALNKFNEYQFGKYKGAKKSVSLVDLFRLVHPKPIQGNEELFRKVLNDELEIPNTWETRLSSGEDKKTVWEDLIRTNSLGGLAALRNIRNMMQVGVNRNLIDQAITQMNVSKLVPLNFLTSVRIVPEFKKQIETRFLDSLKYLNKLPGKTLIIVDVSMSMNSLTSSESISTRLDKACTLALVAAATCENYELVATAGNDSSGIGKHHHIKYPILGFDLAKQIEDTRSIVGGGGIFTRQCLEWCKTNLGENFDRILVISDSQDCDKQNKVPKPYGIYNYLINIASDSKSVAYKGVWTAEISGWSTAFVKYILAYEGIQNHEEDEGVN
jgi:60 kDa SS-A/Ro ribonucleoprotein